MDLTESIVPRSDQTNAEDFLTGPRTVTITAVRAGTAEQPVDVELAEFPGRPFKPSKSMRRVMVAAWGKDSTGYVGRRMTLYRDPDVKFGGIATGGIRISHMSGLDKALSLALTTTRGKRAMFTVQPLVEAARPARPATDPAPTAEQVAASTDVDTLRGMWQAADAATRALITARVAELTAEPADEDPWALDGVG